MREKFPAVRYRDLVRVANRLGFYFYRQASGSHEIWRRDFDKVQTTIPNHGSKPIKRRTFMAILDDFGIHWKEFIKILKSKSFKA